MVKVTPLHGLKTDAPCFIYKRKGRCLLAPSIVYRMCEHLQIFSHIIKPSTSKIYREMQGELIYHVKKHKNSLHTVDLFENTH